MKDSLEILPVTPLIGAEVIGIDLSEPLTNHQKDAIHKAFLKHSVLFFRNQDISVEQQKDFGRSFGELHIHPARDRNGLEVILRFYTSTLGPIHQGLMEMSGTQTCLVMNNLPLAVF